VTPLLKHTVLPSDITNDLTFGYPYYTSLYVPFLGGRRFIQISHDSSPLTLTWCIKNYSLPHVQEGNNFEMHASYHLGEKY